MDGIVVEHSRCTKDYALSSHFFHDDDDDDDAHRYPSRQDVHVQLVLLPDKVPLYRRKLAS